MAHFGFGIGGGYMFHPGITPLGMMPVFACRHCGIQSHDADVIGGHGTHHHSHCARYPRGGGGGGGSVLVPLQWIGGDSRGSSSSEYTELGTMTLYHATNASAASSIRSGNFRCGSSGCVGGGIYFADSASAAKHKSRYGSDVVLKADVRMGRALTIRGGCGSHSCSSGSVYLPNGAGGGNASAEYVVFDNSRISNIQYD